ncbi:MAG: RNA polymerase sigma-70 factor [Chitinophagaceae bacterium]
MEQNKNEQFWIAEFKRGNPQALSYFHKLHYQPLCYFAEKLIHEKDEAEDIVADAFIKIWKIHFNFETFQNIKAFLYITTRNACFNYLKQVQRKNGVHKEILYMSEEEERFVLNEVVESEVLNEVYKEIEELPTKCRRIFKMLYVDGLKSEEIAGLLNISIHTVRAQRARALQLIRVVLLKKRTVLVLIGCAGKWWNW